MINRLFTRFTLLIGLGLIGAPFAWAQDSSEDYRLPTTVVPQAQEIHLRLDPSVADYSGETTVALQVETEVERIGVHQVGLELSEIVLTGGGETRRLEASQGDWDISWLADGERIPPGDYELSVQFSGSYWTDSLGMHRVRYEDHDYIFTQMEAMYARRAFPLFDEPSFKLPYTLIVTAPKDLTVIANTPVDSTSVEGEQKRVTFLPTKPLPSYLLAFAVGPLDRAPLEGMSVPGYVYTPKGESDRLGFVLRETPKIVAELEDYFGSDYPFRKLDFVAVPEFAFGAMENPGLITYRTDLLLVGDEASGTTAERTLMVIAHEVAHIWYGDVVTMEWWNDLWLNEAFASWMAWSTVAKLYPQYDSALKLPQANAFCTDQQTTTQPIRRTVRNNDEIFDGLGLNYSKGHAILSMLENYVGADVWQEAVRAYIEEHAWGNATERDLWRAVSEVSGLDVADIAGDYLNQAGFALVTIDADGELRQERYLLPGSEAPELTWSVPLNVKYKAGGDVRQTFYLLEDETGTLDLPADAEWVFPDAGGNGYYRWQTGVDQLHALVDDVDSLTNREKIALLDNSEALFNANELSLADYLFVLERLLAEPYPLVFRPSLEKLKGIGDNFVDERVTESFQSFVNDTLSTRFEEVGAENQPGDSEAMLQMRPRLLRVLGEHGAHDAALEAARDLTERFLADPDSVGLGVAQEALRVTALKDDGALYEDYLDAYRKRADASQKTAILSAIYFDDADVVNRHLDFLLTDEVPAGDVARGLSLYSTVLKDNTPVFDWLENNLDALMAKMPAYYHVSLPQIVGGGCSEAALARLNDFFDERDEQFQATLAKANEASSACIQRKQQHIGDLQKFLAGN